MAVKKMTKKEGEKQEVYQIEHPVRCSPNILFTFLSTNSGLQEWYADKVVQEGDLYSFFWNRTSEQAQVVAQEPDKFIRFQRLKEGKQTDEYFEFRIEKTEISNQTVLIIIDTAKVKDIDDQKRLWEHQLKTLFHRVGIH